MRLLISCIAIALLTNSLAVHASENFSAPSAPLENTPPAPSNFHFIGQIGLTVGGDNILSAQYNPGVTNHLRAGDLQEFGLGVLWQPPNAPVAAQLSVNFQNDNFQNNLLYAEKFDNGFNRYPIELLTYFTGIAGYRIGAGAVFVQAPQAFANSNSASVRINFKNTTGTIFEIGRQFGDSAWFGLRYVSERFQPDNMTQNGVVTSLANSPAINGSHFGIFITSLFDEPKNITPSTNSSSIVSGNSGLYVAPVTRFEYQDAHYENQMHDVHVAPAVIVPPPSKKSSSEKDKH